MFKTLCKNNGYLTVPRYFKLDLTHVVQSVHTENVNSPTVTGVRRFFSRGRYELSSKNIILPSSHNTHITLRFLIEFFFFFSLPPFYTELVVTIFNRLIQFKVRRMFVLSVTHRARMFMY